LPADRRGEPPYHPSGRENSKHRDPVEVRMGRVGWLSLVVLVSLLGCKSSASKTEHVIEFRLAGGQGTSEARTETMVLPRSRQKITVERVARFTETDLDSIWVEEDPQRPGRYAVAVCFKSESSDLFRSFTSDHIGESFAIIVDEHLIAAPIIREPLAGERLRILFDLSREDAEEALEELAPWVKPRR
jgi:preprotein translocase subunit SecD